MTTPIGEMLAFPPPPILARAAILIDLDSSAILSSKSPDRRLPMASTTKITTAILALRHARLHDMVRISRNAATVGESTMVLQKGEQVRVRGLLYGLLLNSANDAAVALAEHVGGTRQHFVAMMNDLAGQLGMRNTRYATPHGLDAPNHFTSARDLATVTQYALRDPVFQQIVATTGYHIKPTKKTHEHWLANINRVMYWYPGVDGVKPGMTDAAGYCQVVTVRRDGRHLLAVLLGTPNLVTDIRNLLNFGFQDFRWVQSLDYGDSPAATITGGVMGGSWLYSEASGHYIRQPFLHYFETHGGAEVLGFPRTEAVWSEGRRVQYFQGAELVEDAVHRSVYPAPLGVMQARSTVQIVWRPGSVPAIAPEFRKLYAVVGGRGVLGTAIGPARWHAGIRLQFCRYGALGMVAGEVPGLVPLGDVTLRQHNIMPASGAGDRFPVTLQASTMTALAPVHSLPLRRAVHVPEPVRTVPGLAAFPDRAGAVDTWIAEVLHTLGAKIRAANSSNS